MRKKISLFIVFASCLSLILLAWFTLTGVDFEVGEEQLITEGILEEDSREKDGDFFETRSELNIFADIAKEVNSAVIKVSIREETTGEEEFFEYFFPGLEPDFREGSGSGVIISDDGYIVTNEHVIGDSEKVIIEIPGVEAPKEAEVVWAEYSYDLALLKIETDNDITSAPLGCSDNIRPGEWVVAIGNPFGYENTVTVGVVGALQRPFNITTREGTRRYRDLIQTDAAINPGNSGGPLLNSSGEVIGINTAVDTMGQGLGFAIPINTVKDFVQELEETGEIIRPWLGVSYVPVSEELAASWDLPDKEGAQVVEVLPDSSAAEAGLQVDDIIIELDGNKVREYLDLADIMFVVEPGEVVEIKVIREGEEKSLTATIGRMPDDF